MKKIISLALAAIMIASLALFCGCGESDPHAGHDHEHDANAEEEADIAAMFPPVAQLTVSANYPDISDYTESDVRKEVQKEGVILLRVAKIEDDQYYCTAATSRIADYIFIDPPVELAVDDFILVSTGAYVMTAERFGFDYGEAFSSFFVVFGDEVKEPLKISAKNAYQIYSTVPTVPDVPGIEADHHEH